MQEGTADSTAAGAGLEVRPVTVSVFGEALDRLYLSEGDEHPAWGRRPLADGRCPVSHLLSRRQPMQGPQDAVGQTRTRPSAAAAL